MWIKVQPFKIRKRTGQKARKNFILQHFYFRSAHYTEQLLNLKKKQLF